MVSFPCENSETQDKRVTVETVKFLPCHEMECNLENFWNIIRGNRNEIVNTISPQRGWNVNPQCTNASTCSGLDVREHITLLNREIQQQAEEYKREMEAWKKRYETDVTRLQTPLDTQSAEFDQWKSHVSQMYTFMQQMQPTSSSAAMPPPPPPAPFSARPPRPPPTVTASAPTRSDTHPDDGLPLTTRTTISEAVDNADAIIQHCSSAWTSS
ncbi:hypothetical protein PIB30_072298 [Stylosanthes scabra]|uniref:Uncharacterized protein n=1 Tax=Stylosanthes scabra TaxID=79078 RepID=A0ABU6UMT0_9FABA|nr:hypothetical protein [Stylosanthes scabra]